MPSSSGGGERDKLKLGKRDRSDSALEKEGGRENKIVKSATKYEAVFKLKEQIVEGFRALNPLKNTDSLRTDSLGKS